MLTDQDLDVALERAEQADPKVISLVPDLVAELRAAREMQARYRAHLERIRGRWLDAEGTPLVGERGLPWAMADDARAALTETIELPCSSCAPGRVAESRS